MRRPSLGSRAALMAAALVLTACIPGAWPDGAGAQDGVVTTVGAPPPEVGPPLEEIPANPRRVIVLEEGPDTILDSEHLAFLESRPGMIVDTATVEAVHPGVDGRPISLLVFETNDPRMGNVTCRATAPAGESPSGIGCSGGGAVSGEKQITGMGSSWSDDGDRSVEVEHTPDADAVVIELEDGSTFVIRPGDSTFSFHQWNGPDPIRITVFWNDGTTSSEVMPPP